ncbi:helix-turn-helix domain-containing protein [Iamia sp.]|uniref:helix-turn-helix domain-containing protein n=1 Tax=Iamia sp. TaxID=2722710 RepID=UPI002C8ABCBA|nr:helix-turn-helix domain-containing protein [Iamia sp.]HXH55730.1 helix-turn-helix domain-containing protein [Iamia sp.]
MAPVVRSDAPPVDLASFVAATRDEVGSGARLRLLVGGVTCEIDGELAEGIVTFLQAAASGSSVDVTALSPELTTGQAADLLGVSRPTVVALVDKGTLPASRVGTHRRIRTSDLLAYRERSRRDRRAALDEVIEVSDELGLYE